jgi:hypothetical protein
MPLLCCKFIAVTERGFANLQKNRDPVGGRYHQPPKLFVVITSIAKT